MNIGLETLAARWSAMQSVDQEYGEAEVAIICAVEELTERPEELWEFVQLALPLCTAERAKGMLAAGPLEDLIQEHGAEFVERIERLSETDPAFASLLSAVWVAASEDPVTLRYLALGCDQVRPLA